MTTSQLSAARAIWRARRERSGGDKAYALYAFILVAMIVIVPVVRALWLIASSPAGLAVLASADASAAVSLIAAVLWAGALLAGRKRGPALLPPFLLYALTGSSIRRALTLRQPVLRSAAIIVATCTAGAALAGTILFADGHAQLGGVVVFATGAGAAGVVAAMLWLVGQVFPRAAFPIALTVLILAGTSLSIPEMFAFTPWGSVGATYPLAGSGALSLVYAGVLAIAAIVLTPVLLDRLTGMQLSTQAARWERATAFSFSFDFRAATTVYEAEPHLGRNLRAVNLSKHRWATFFLRDAIGQLRTPGRSLGAITATVAAGALIALSLLPDAPAALLAGTAGIVIYSATGPLTKGLQHAASVAGDYPLYGISDRRLVLLHSLFPLTVVLTVLPIAASITAPIVGTGLGLALTGACAVGILALALRLGNALKGPIPPSLLTPVNTPAGDLSIVMQLGWALSDPLTAILSALTITMLPITPIPLAILTISVGALVFARWRKRR
ncbi:hypothetical protein [Microbacterium lacticum]